MKEAKKKTIYFLNLKKRHAEKSIIRRLVTDKQELVKYDHLNNEIFSNFKSLFERTDEIDKMNYKTLLESSLYLL